MRLTDCNYAALGVALLYPEELRPEEALVRAGLNTAPGNIVRDTDLLDMEACQMLALRKQGYTWQEIGKRFGIPGKGSAQHRVRRYLERRAV